MNVFSHYIAWQALHVPRRFLFVEERSNSLVVRRKLTSNGLAILVILATICVVPNFPSYNGYNELLTNITKSWLYLCLDETLLRKRYYSLSKFPETLSDVIMQCLKFIAVANFDSPRCSIEVCSSGTQYDNNNSWLRMKQSSYLYWLQELIHSWLSCFTVFSASSSFAPQAFYYLQPSRWAAKGRF